MSNKNKVNNHTSNEVKESNNKINNLELVVYTDGSYRGGINEASYAAIVLYEGIEELIIAGKAKSKDKITNCNEIELLAVLNILKEIEKRKINENIKITLRSDSNYVCKGINRSKNKKLKIKPEYNTTIWQQIYYIFKKIKFECEFVKGHNGDHYNTFCDRLCKLILEEDKIKIKNLLSEYNLESNLLLNSKLILI